MRRRNWKQWDARTSRLAHEAKGRIRLKQDYDREPVMVPWCRFRITVTDKLTGERGSFELRSIRDAVKRLAVVVKYLS